MQALVVINLVTHRRCRPFVGLDDELIFLDAFIRLHVRFLQAKEDRRCVVLVKLLDDGHLSA